MVDQPGALNGYISHRLAEAHREINISLQNRLKACGVQLEAWRVMEILDEVPGITMSKLATLVLMNPPALTKLVDRMVSNSLVHRQIGKKDHRQVNLILTDLGLKRMSQIRGEVKSEDERIIEMVGRDNFDVLTDLLSKISTGYR